MFERRLKILLLILVLATSALVVRAFQIQVIQRDDWRKKASESMTHIEYTDTTRGRIVDRLGRTLAGSVLRQVPLGPRQSPNRQGSRRKLFQRCRIRRL